MIELDAGIAQQLAEEATPSSAIQVRVGTSNSELIIASILQPLIHQEVFLLDEFLIFRLVLLYLDLPSFSPLEFLGSATFIVLKK